MQMRVMSHLFLLGKSEYVLNAVADGVVDSCVTDPPYDLTNKRPGGRSEKTRGKVMGGFMGLEWDASGIAHQPDFWCEVLRTMKPGAHLLAFGGTRTYHRMACAIEDAGFEIRDMLQWIYGSGFPKNRNLGDGVGTALKPAVEPICLARKPLEKGLSIHKNYLKFGTGGINIDACRVPTDEVLTGSGGAPLKYAGANARPFHETAVPLGINQHPNGRWPANVLLDGSSEVLAYFPETDAGGNPTGREQSKRNSIYNPIGQRDPWESYGDSGSASRFFYCAKADKYDRHSGMPLPEPVTAHGSTMRDREDARWRGNHHPTVKPVDLMRYLVRLVTPPQGVVLDPFLGSGSTAKACLIEQRQCVGIEMNSEYLEIAKTRLNELQVQLF